MRNVAAFIAAFALGAVLTGRLAAAPAAKAPEKKDCPINVASDKFTADLNAKTGTWSQNVIVTQCDVKLRADNVRISTLNNEADKVTANGNVVVDSPKTGTATGNSGIYDVPKKLVTLTGNVVLKKGKDVMRGQMLTVNLTTGQANLGGGAKAPGQQNSGRVQAVFNPKSGDQ